MATDYSQAGLSKADTGQLQTLASSLRALGMSSRADSVQAEIDRRARVQAEATRQTQAQEKQQQAAKVGGIQRQQQATVEQMAKPYEQLATQYANERANIDQSPAIQALKQSMTGPSAAEMAMRRQADVNQRQIMGAAYGRGGANPANVRAALMAGQQMQQEAAGQGAAMAAQERAQATQAYAQAYLGQQAQLGQNQLAALSGLTGAQGAGLGLASQERMLLAQQEQAQQAFQYQQQLAAEAAQRQFEYQQQLAAQAQRYQRQNWFTQTFLPAAIGGGAAMGAAYLGRPAAKETTPTPSPNPGPIAGMPTYNPYIG